ncbi:uncharacterized protein SPSK_03783 [Sporothrix schenckii 1099-18]|uniref:Uncharacterized protein n=1 Tax=Sporothrix schenckii 1099-18 TaxID=1397361 RepID=A0A0F2M0I6_SPOSC|nr:uncharacterized protein SPSK_03783 [Sporothrix schenckii 1099-18]KJR82275.1 hypothetical protein SPSK_03783 [Sporothrix schenckii 1099-18]
MQVDMQLSEPEHGRGQTFSIGTYQMERWTRPSRYGGTAEYMTYDRRCGMQRTSNSQAWSLAYARIRLLGRAGMSLVHKWPSECNDYEPDGE